VQKRTGEGGGGRERIVQKRTGGESKDATIIRARGDRIFECRFLLIGEHGVTQGVNTLHSSFGGREDGNLFASRCELRNGFSMIAEKLDQVIWTGSVLVRQFLGEGDKHRQLLQQK
jgi:hypothetical protein